MSIDKIGSDLVRSSAASRPERGTAAPKHQDAEELGRVERADRVDFSAEGRELAAEYVRRAESLSESRAAVIQGRIDGGYYDDPGVAEEVAAGILASGDLDVRV